MNNIQNYDMDVTTSLTAVETLSNVGTKALVTKRAIYMFTKRSFDIVFSLIGCLFLLPITAVIKICYIVTGDFEPIIFTQKRIGKGGKLFTFYKFRSMCKNADEVLFKLLSENPERAEEYRINKKLKNDPRITKIGRIIRKTSIDELPQLINILKGEMSIVGNRPYLPREKDDMGYFYYDIIKTKPGLTGLWQVSGRSDTTFHKRMELETYYSNCCGLKMDMKIFLKTFKTVLVHKGAK